MRILNISAAALCGGLLSSQVARNQPENSSSIRLTDLERAAR